MSKIRLGVIGTGMAWRRLHLPAVQALNELYEVVAMCNTGEEKLIHAADEIGLSHEHVYSDYNRMLEQEEIDAVDILVPIEDNYDIAKGCAKHGVNIICEKPLAGEYEDALRYLKFEEKYGVKILIAENFRYNEENNIIRELVKTEKIGEVLYFIKHNNHVFKEEMVGDTYAAKEWRQYPLFAGGTLLDGGVHDIAGLNYIFGDVDTVSAVGEPSNDSFSPYRSVNAVLRFKSGVTGNYIHSSFCKESQHPLVGFRIMGTEGEIYLEDKTCGFINVSYHDGRPHELIQYKPKQGFINEMKSFYEVLVNNNREYVKPEIAFEDVKVIFAIMDAIELNKVINVNDKVTFFTKVGLGNKTT